MATKTRLKDIFPPTPERILPPLEFPNLALAIFASAVRDKIANVAAVGACSVQVMRNMPDWCKLVVESLEAQGTLLGAGGSAHAGFRRLGQLCRAFHELHGGDSGTQPSVKSDTRAHLLRDIGECCRELADTLESYRGCFFNDAEEYLMGYLVGLGHDCSEEDENAAG